MRAGGRDGQRAAARVCLDAASPVPRARASEAAGRKGRTVPNTAARGFFHTEEK